MGRDSSTGFLPEKPEEASRRTYRFWRRRLEEMQDEVESLERYIHRWEHGRVAEDEQVLREGELLDMGEARKRQPIDELQRYPDVEIRKKNHRGVTASLPEGSNV